MASILDQYGNVTNYIHVDGDTVYQGQSQDVDPILKNNADLRTENDGYSPDRDLRRVANIPTTVIMEWCKQAGISIHDWMRNPKHYAKWFRKKVYDGDNAMFLTAPHFKGSKKDTNFYGIDDLVKQGRKSGAL